LSVKATKSEAENMDQESALRQVIADYQHFVNAGNGQGYTTLFTDDVVWMPPNSPDREGGSEILDAQVAAFSKFKFNVELTPTEVRALSEDWGLVLCTVRAVLTPRSEGDVVEMRLRGVFVMAKQPDGRWLIARQIWNQKPQEDMPGTGRVW
jgi:uncharacterized protein (TIGR02246 family)